MAFRNRGGLGKNDSVAPHSVTHKRPINVNIVFLHRYKDYSEYLLAQFIGFVAICVILCISIIVLNFTYESAYIYDPIMNIKNSFLELQFVGVIISAILLIIGLSIRKTSKNIFKYFLMTTLCMLSVIFIAVCGMVNFNNKYNETTFAEMYNESYLKINITGDKQQFFVDECNKLNEKFEFKVVTYSVMQYMLIIVNLYLLYTELKVSSRYEQIEKENEVLFDEEQNVKI